jgi:hypothetical protein
MQYENRARFYCHARKRNVIVEATTEKLLCLHEASMSYNIEFDITILIDIYQMKIKKTT